MTLGNYGEKGFEAMERLSSTNGTVCIAHSQKVKSLADVDEYEKILTTLMNLKNRPQAAVCFCEGLSMKKVFQAQKRLRRTNPFFRPFQWIGSDSWADR